MEEFKLRLNNYFKEKNILDEELQNSIKERLGQPLYEAKSILKDIDNETQSYTYDVQFESILDLYSNIFEMDNSRDMWESICGYMGTDTLFITNELEGISVTTR